MNRPDRALHELARRVMRAEHAVTPVTTPTAAEAMQRSCGQLYRTLETALGPGALQALLDRAAQITARDHPWLAGVKAGHADCVFSGLRDAAGPLDVDQVIEGYAALLATTIWLLATFIGEDLTIRFARHAWPAMSISGLSEGEKR